LLWWLEPLLLEHQRRILKTWIEVRSNERGTIGMKMKMFGWLIVAGLLYVCPNAKGQSFTVDLIGAITTSPTIGGISSSKTTGANWGITSGSVTISPTGAVKGKITGLLIPGAGTATVIAVTLVCGGTVAGTTPSFALNTEGDAKIKGPTAKITLPSRCDGAQVLIVVTEFMGAPVPFADTNYIADGGFLTSSTSDATTPWGVNGGGQNARPLASLGKQP
jgi:hypothetical protein